MYGKIHDSIFSSSLLEGKPPDQIHTAYVFMCLLTIADAGDEITESREVLASMFRVSRETLDQAILELERPDPMSRTPDSEGRRLVRLDDRRDWGWRIVNRGKYKKMTTADDRREYQRNLMRDRRLHSVSSTLAPVSHVSAGSRQEAVGSRQKARDLVPAARSRFVPPTLQEVTEYCFERKNQVDPLTWIDHYASNGWKVGRNPMKDWKAAVRTWERSGVGSSTFGASSAFVPEPKKGLDPALEKLRKQREEWERENRE